MSALRYQRCLSPQPSGYTKLFFCDVRLYKAALQLIGFGSEEKHSTEISRKVQHIKVQIFKLLNSSGKTYTDETSGGRCDQILKKGATLVLSVPSLKLLSSAERLNKRTSVFVQTMDSNWQLWHKVTSVRAFQPFRANRARKGIKVEEVGNK